MKIAWVKISIITLCVAYIPLVNADLAYAGLISGWSCVQQNPPALSCIPSVVENFIGGLLYFSGTVAMVFIVFGGIKYLLSRGDPKQVEGARKTLN